ncbi:MAG: STAS domain-containing protein [Desulfobacterales bacterium]|nr:STAS domain-containing protein [Desulfobacterales bacterium]
MGFTLEEKNEQALLKIEGALTIYEVASLRHELLMCFENYNDLVLDLSNTNDLDTAGIQLICSAQKTAKQTGKTLKITNVSKCFYEAASLIGLDTENTLNFV